MQFVTIFDVWSYIFILKEKNKAGMDIEKARGQVNSKTALVKSNFNFSQTTYCAKTYMPLEKRHTIGNSVTVHQKVC